MLCHACAAADGFLRVICIHDQVLKAYVTGAIGTMCRDVCSAVSQSMLMLTVQEHARLVLRLSTGLQDDTFKSTHDQWPCNMHSTIDRDIWKAALLAKMSANADPAMSLLNS